MEFTDGRADLVAKRNRTKPKKKSPEIAQMVNDTTTPVMMGRTYGHNPREAHLAVDEVYIYDYALSQQEIIYLAGISEITSPLESAYDLYEDGKIDFRDFAVFADYWLEEQPWP